MPESNEPGSVLCVDIGGTSTKIGVFDRGERTQILDSIATQGPTESFADSLCQIIRQAWKSAGRTDAGFLGVGVAVAGFLNDDRDRMIYNSNLPWLEGYPLRDRLTNELDTRVQLEVDSNAAALAEQHLGVGRNSARFLCITVGTGIGVGMIINGEPLRFAYGCMGDAGHIVVQANGPLCTCGGRGCAEILISAPVLAEEYRIKSGLQFAVSLRDVIEAARVGDHIANGILERAGEWLGIATASMANIFFPEHIAFAGGLAEAGDLVMKSLEKTFYYSASKFARDQVTLSRAKLGAMATLTGAAYSILDRRR
jgi:glucokinase